MKSMTGFGRGTATGENGTSVAIEISAVNSRKQQEIRFSAPRELLPLEQDLRGTVQKKLSRGNLNITISYQLGTGDGSAAFPVDKVFATMAAKQLRALALETGLPAPTMSDLLQVPGVIKITDRTTELVKPLIFQALDKALQELDSMRDKEGAALKADLTARGNAMSELLEKITAREDEAVLCLKNKLMERIAKLGTELPADDERLAREVAFYVDKSDITEETVRLKSHLAQYAALMEQSGEIGRNLDFLCQEMGREVNTLSSKTADTPISQHALAMKIELSKIKEQIMNVE